MCEIRQVACDQPSAATMKLFSRSFAAAAAAAAVRDILHNIEIYHIRLLAGLARGDVTDETRILPSGHRTHRWTDNPET